MPTSDMPLLFCTISILHIGIPLLFLTGCEARLPAYRICKPGPPLGYPVDSTLKNCLIIGDSVSIGYAPQVKEMLSGTCQVQHAPWDGTDGGALDTKYALECMSLFLSTTSGKTTHYDAIVFNFGLHDVQFCPGRHEEEYVSYEEYLRNIDLIYSRLNQTGAKVGFVSTTPVPFSKLINDRVKKYNSGVKMMLNKSSIGFADLYEKVVDICGEPPFNSCFIMNKQPNVHYKGEGYSYLAVFVSKLFITLLKQAKNPGERRHPLVKEKHWTGDKIKQVHNQNWKICPKDKFITMKKWKRNSLKSHKHKSSCERSNTMYGAGELEYQVNVATACPSSMTCSKSVFSHTGIGCCVIPNATTCSDGLHCCPPGMNCSENCGKGVGLCFCVSEKEKRKVKRPKNFNFSYFSFKFSFSFLNYRYLLNGWMREDGRVQKV